MNPQKIGIIHYQAGNMASVMNALARLGVKAKTISTAEEAGLTDKLIFPGVGHARKAMEAIKNQGLEVLLKQYERPLLGICLGMQLMGQHSEEGDTPGLSLFRATALAFQGRLKVPHMGWNRVTSAQGELYRGIPDGSHFYFVHSYQMPLFEDTTGICHYGVPFTASVANKHLYGVQFHPEKSGDAGMQILKNFISL